MIPTKLRIVERINSMTMQQPFHLDSQSLRHLEKECDGVVKILSDHVDDVYHLEDMFSVLRYKTFLGNIKESNS